ncbi:MAG: T9SS type A sorting domain-containing protein [Bacteroidales bacterium]|nr:MAG: T9SS type A sorting domain-containing protein [Bacteroidales bacterium]
MKNLVRLSRILIPVLILLVIQLSRIYSQAPKWDWARSAGEAVIFQSVTDTVGNTVVFGSFTTASIRFGSFVINGISSGESNNLYLVKYNSAGRVLWATSIFGSDANTTLKPIKLDVNERGTIVIMATSDNTPDIQVSNATLTFGNINENVFIAKYFKTGRLIWARAARTAGGLMTSTGSDALIDNLGNVYATGNFNADTIWFGPQYLPGDTMGARLFFVKYNPLGSLDWAKTAQADNAGTGSIYGTFLAMHNEEIYLAGNYNGDRSFIFGSDTLPVQIDENIFLVKYTSIGNYEWVRGYGDEYTDLPDNLQIDNDGNIYLVGVYNSPQLDFYGQLATNSGPFFDVFVTKLDPAGNPMSVQNINSQLTSIRNTPGTNTRANIDDENNLCIITEFMGPSVLYNFTQRDNAEVGTRDIIITKINMNTGEFLWALAGNSPGDNMFNSAVFDRFGSIYLSGNVNINPLVYNDVDATNFIIADTLGIDNGGFYFIKINKLGDIQYARSKINAADNSMTGNSFSVDYFGNVYLAGNFAGAGTNLDGIPVTEAGDIGMYMAKFAYVADISGNVFDVEGSPVTAGYVKLYGCTRFQRSPLTDSVPIIGDGSYLFEDIPYGRYIIFARPSANDYPGVAQTYYPSAAQWEDAGSILVTSTEPLTGRDIFINNTSLREGDAFLGGEIYEADTTHVFKSTKSILKKAVKEVDVILAGGRLKSEYDVIAATKTDENGDFAFYNIDDGEYTILADIPGLPHDEMYYVTVSGGEFISNLDYFVGEEYVSKGEGGYTGILENDNKESDNLLIVPNPNNGSFHIYLENINTGLPVTFEIISISGQLMYKETIYNPDTSNLVDIKNISAGIYILKTTIGNNEYQKKLIVR